MATPDVDFDGAWKEALEVYFPAFMEFFLPDAYREIDWTRPHEFLDQELRHVTRKAKRGKKWVDKLVKVWRLNSEQEWVLVHVEIQSQQDAAFGRRMFVYHYRIFDRFSRQVCSVAVLADDSPAWRPDSFGYLWKSSVALRFPMVKLCDYRERWAMLEASTNPFATVVMAHLKTQETAPDLKERLRWRLALVRRLFDQGLERDEILQLARFVEWLTVLTPDLKIEYYQAVESYEKEEAMTFMTYAERKGHERGLEEGRQEGLREAIILALDVNFSAGAEDLIPLLAQVNDIDRLQHIYRHLLTGATVDELRQMCANP